MNSEEQNVHIDHEPNEIARNLTYDLINCRATIASLNPKQTRRFATSRILPRNHWDYAKDENLLVKLKALLKCKNRDYIMRTEQRGDFWVMRNYVQANHGPLECTDSITFSTHADHSYLDNVVPLLERWMGPISLALYTPGTDFLPAFDSIRYLRDCGPYSNLVREFVTFHVYFEKAYVPNHGLRYLRSQLSKKSFNCSLAAPYTNVERSTLFRSILNLSYPINVGRNIAREATMTHFVLASDIELYPTPDLIRKFLEMIARNEGPLLSKNPRVFPLNIFEVEEFVKVPEDKPALIRMLKENLAIPFHKKICPYCHKIPKANAWLRTSSKDGAKQDLNIFTVAKRRDNFLWWEPIFIGTRNDPLYDESFTWEGRKDKMIQAYIMCLLDYDFFILDNAFLVHKPGIKIYTEDKNSLNLTTTVNKLYRTIVNSQLKMLYGIRKGC
ncbi:beta-1,4-glucuronyltransferase 1-like [Ctenocephalides felis]|uniref:beta-1,4-glucuronyltransferase 1-like n=1 Tax=Ctenocephalides felis TaxID=7515 RepID=UPI000E6E396B|nr:beta-1,4-glucuronyltransferase 1-like [Ctenocephalides felis]